MRLGAIAASRRRSGGGGGGGGGTTATKWRILVTAGPGGHVSIAELEMRATPGGADQCSGGTATASTDLGVGYTPDLAFDNNDSSFWHTSAPLPAAVWLAYEFPAAVDVTQVALRLRPDNAGSPPADFAIQKDAGAGWTTVWSVTGATWSAGGEQQLFTKP